MLNQHNIALHFSRLQKWKFSLCSLWGKHVIKHRRSEEFVLAVAVAGSLLHLTLAFYFFNSYGEFFFFFWSCAYLRMMMMMSHLITTVSVNALFWFKELSFELSGSWAWICSKPPLLEKTEIKLTRMTPGFMAHAHSAGVVPLFPLVAEGWKYPTQVPVWSVLPSPSPMWVLPSAALLVFSFMFHPQLKVPFSFCAQVAACKAQHSWNAVGIESACSSCFGE